MSFSNVFKISLTSDKVLEEVVGRVGSDVIDCSYNGDEVRLEKDDYITIRTKQEQLDALAEQFEKGKVSEENYNRRKESIKKTPDFVHAHAFFKVDGKYYPFGDILTRRDGSGRYLKLKLDEIIVRNNGRSVKFKKDACLNVSTRQQQIDSANYLLSNNRMSEETHEKVMSDINNTPEFIVAKVTGKGELV